MNSTFFEALSIANLEKIHSQMISWIFNQSTLNDIGKTKLLNKLFTLEDITLTDFKSYTEYNSMDIVIVTNKKIYVIENKLKSSQHSDQLNNYKMKIEADKNFEHIQSINFGYLTLVGEESNNTEWINITYKDLFSSLTGIFKFQENYHNPSEVIINEYINTLKNLVTIFDKFDNDHKVFPNVFNEAGKKKYIKLNTCYPTKEQEYISNGNLETIFQKHFLRKISRGLKISGYSHHIGETKGKALIHIDLKRVEINGYDFHLGFQYQDNTIKFNIGAKEYESSSLNWILADVYSYMKSLTKTTDFKSFNPPKKYAYASISKKIKNVYQVETEDLITELNQNILICEKLAEEFVKKIKNEGWNTSRTIVY